jgi:hypothetical protein
VSAVAIPSRRRSRGGLGGPHVLHDCLKAKKASKKKTGRPKANRGRRNEPPVPSEPYVRGMFVLAVIEGLLVLVALGACVLTRREADAIPAAGDVGASVRDTLARMAATLDRIDLDRRGAEAELSERLRGVSDTQRGDRLRRVLGLHLRRNRRRSRSPADRPAAPLQYAPSNW